jgi:succinylglutamate desuccinylase
VASNADTLDRILGRFGPKGGPTLVVVSGLHGNEPAGVRASQRVQEALTRAQTPLQGELVLVLGNVSAFQEGQRYVERDLNRAWTADQIRFLQENEGTGVEDREQQDLLQALESILEGAQGQVYLLDLHTTSASGAAFSAVADVLQNRDLALALPVPLVLGLEEMVEGTLHDYMGERGVVTVAFESGQHDEPRAVDRAEAAVWITMAATGVARAENLPHYLPALESLRRDSLHLPRAVEMRHRHAVRSDDAFRMKPGFRNFQRVTKGEVIATDRRGPVLAPESGRILMPLYQAKGNDGFFLVREFRHFWLRLSAKLRALGVDRHVHWLPGIRKHPEDSDTLIVDRRVARWYAMQVLHLLGFRREVEVDKTLVVQRRSAP